MWQATVEYPWDVLFWTCRSVWFRSCKFDEGGEEVTGKWRSLWASRLFRAAGNAQRTQRAGKMGGGKEINLYGSGSIGVLKAEGEVAGERRIMEVVLG